MGPPSEAAPAPPSGSHPEDECFQITRRGALVCLQRDGVLSLASARSRSADLIPYDEITHVAASRRALWIGSTRGVHMLRRGRRTSMPMDRICDSLLARIAARPGGRAQLARIAEVGQLERTTHWRVATFVVAIACVVGWIFQVRDPFTSEVGAFVPDLVAQGEWWRIVTGNFLHDRFPLHIVTNLMVLFLFSHLVERLLGASRTAVIMGCSALGAMGASAWVGYEAVVGASGIVAGMAGAALCLELHHPGRLPATRRIPRQLFVVVLLAQVVLDWVVPFFAGAAHLGGFAAGYAAAWVCARSRLDPPSERAVRPPWLRPLAAALALSAAAALAGPAQLLLRDVDALNRYGRDLLSAEVEDASRLNDVAWRLATESDAQPGQLGVALELANRAVERTERGNPDLLDTLAEVQFMSGDAQAAVATIDEAIAIAPWDDYFRQQRERFIGRRSADDRPEDPTQPWQYRRPRDLEPWREPGIEI